jgi:uncharacterized protein YqeY
MKSKDKLALEVYRGLKTRLANEKIAKGQLTDESTLLLIRSEIKRRKEAAESYASAGRTDMSEKELSESTILEQFLPAQLSDEELLTKINEQIEKFGKDAKNFGLIMGALKKELGSGVDGARLSEKLKSLLS